MRNIEEIKDWRDIRVCDSCLKYIERIIVFLSNYDHLSYCEWCGTLNKKNRIYEIIKNHGCLVVK